MEEPVRSNDLPDMMREYRRLIRDTSKNKTELTGVLLLAVARAKVAEGTDFRDNDARCVITVSFKHLF